MTPLPWHVAARRANVGNFKHPIRTASDYIRLRAFDWLRIHGATGRVVAYVHAADDATLILAAPKLYVAVRACHEALRYPRGLTDGEWSELRRQVGEAVLSIAVLIEEGQRMRDGVVGALNNFAPFKS